MQKRAKWVIALALFAGIGAVSAVAQEPAAQAFPCMYRYYADTDGDGFRCVSELCEYFCCDCDW